MSLIFRGWILITALTMAVAAQSAPPEAQTKFRISGTVVDAVRGEALPDVEVKVSQERTVLQTVITGPDGRFQFDGLAPAKYSLSARGHGYQPQGYQQHHLATTGIVTGPRLESENLVFRLKPEASISGTVTDESSAPVPLAEVLLFAGGYAEAPQAILLRLKTTANDAGYFHFGHLREGKYYLVVVARPWYARSDPEEVEQKTSAMVDGDAGALEERSVSPDATASVAHHHSDLDVAFQTRYYINATEPELATPIVLKPGERATADLHLLAVPALRLKVRGTPAFTNAASSLVLSERIFSYSRQISSQSIDQDGIELNSLAPGRYLLELPSQGPDGLPQQRPLELVTDGEVVPGESSTSVSTVTGTIQLEGIQGLCQRCNLRFVSLPSGEVFTTRSTSNGFQIDGGIRAGTYLVREVSMEDYLVKDISAVGARVVRQQVEIPPGVAVRLSIAMTRDSGTIEGVALQNGKPVSQAAVFLVPNDPAHNLELFRGDQSDSDGTFTLRQILSGEYTVLAIAEGWDLEWSNPAALKPFIGGGVRVRVEPRGKYRIAVAVQALGGAPK